jgi:hypothetical protein
MSLEDRSLDILRLDASLEDRASALALLWDSDNAKSINLSGD